jgi:heme exporter protein D
VDIFAFHPVPPSAVVWDPILGHLLPLNISPIAARRAPLAHVEEREERQLRGRAAQRASVVISHRAPSTVGLRRPPRMRRSTSSSSPTRTSGDGQASGGQPHRAPPRGRPTTVRQAAATGMTRRLPTRVSADHGDEQHKPGASAIRGNSS